MSQIITNIFEKILNPGRRWKTTHLHNLKLVGAASNDSHDMWEINLLPCKISWMYGVLQIVTYGTKFEPSVN